jgi:hypothetical protein
MRWRRTRHLAVQCLAERAAMAAGVWRTRQAVALPTQRRVAAVVGAPEVAVGKGTSRMVVLGRYIAEAWVGPPRTVAALAMALLSTATVASAPGCIVVVDMRMRKTVAVPCGRRQEAACQQHTRTAAAAAGGRRQARCIGLPEAAGTTGGHVAAVAVAGVDASAAERMVWPVAPLGTWAAARDSTKGVELKVAAAAVAPGARGAWPQCERDSAEAVGAATWCPRPR